MICFIGCFVRVLRSCVPWLREIDSLREDVRILSEQVVVLTADVESSDIEKLRENISQIAYSARNILEPMLCEHSDIVNATLAEGFIQRGYVKMLNSDRLVSSMASVRHEVVSWLNVVSDLSIVGGVASCETFPGSELESE